MSDERISEERLVELEGYNYDFGPHNFPGDIRPITRSELEKLLAAYRARDEGDGEVWRLLDDCKRLLNFMSSGVAVAMVERIEEAQARRATATTATPADEEPAR